MEKSISLNTVICGDSLVLMKDIPNNSIDLIFTSPPYADLRSYLKIDPDEYVSWFIPFAREFYRLLSPTGSFILNINDRVVNKERHLYVFDLVCALKRDIKFRYFERFIWVKTRCQPWGSKRRVTDSIEYVFWFYKDNYVFNDNVIRKPYSKASLMRYKTKYIADKNNFRVEGEIITPNVNGAKANNVLFLTPANEKHISHTAPFPVELPEFFIKAATNTNQIVLDPFVGSGTTVVAAKKLGRRYLGIDVIAEYIDTAQQRLNKVEA